MADEQTDSTNAGGKSDDKASDEKIRSIVSGIVRSQMKTALAEALGPSLKGLLESELAPLREQITKQAAPKQDDAQAKKPVEGAPAPQEDPRLLELQKKLDKLESEAKESKRAAQAERKRSLETKSFSDLRQALNGRLRSEAVEVAAELLRARGALTHDEDGNARLKFKVEDEDRELSLEDGIAHFLKSKEASLFVPPPSGGAGPNKRPPPVIPTGGTSSLSGGGAQAPGDPLQAVEQATGRSFADLFMG